MDKKTVKWSPIIVQLHKECEDEYDGPLITRIADRFIEIAVAMIPVIDNWERQGSAP